MADHNTIRKDGPDLDSELDAVDRRDMAGRDANLQEDDSEAKTLVSHIVPGAGQQTNSIDELLSVATSTATPIDPVSSDFGEAEPETPVYAAAGTRRQDAEAEELFAAAGGSVSTAAPVDPVASDFGEVEAETLVSPAAGTRRQDAELEADTEAEELFAAADGSVSTAAPVAPVSSDFGEVELETLVSTVAGIRRQDAELEADAEELVMPADSSVQHDLAIPDVDLGGLGSVGDESVMLDDMVAAGVSNSMQSDGAGLHDLKSLQDTIEELNQEVVSLRKKSDDYREAALQVRAESESEKQRLQRELEKKLVFALGESLQDLLPILDSLEFGLQAADAGGGVDPVALREGLVLTLGLFGKFLDKSGVEVVSSVGMKFDPELHEAVSVQPVAGVAKDQVVTVAQKGYILNGRLVRPAKVIVSG